MSETTTASRHESLISSIDDGAYRPLKCDYIISTKGMVAPSKDQSCSPLPVGAPRRMKSESATTARALNHKSDARGAKNTVQHKQPKGHGIGTPKLGKPGNFRDGKNNQIEQLIIKGTTEYKNTLMYEAAVKSGFKNKTALDRFNVWVRSAAVDPSKIPVCTECGNCDLVLCDHFIVAAAERAVDVEETAVVFPDVVNMKYEFRWVDKVRKMFTWPKFNPGEVSNHFLNGFDNSLIGDDFIINELMNYLRFHMNSSYVVNGTDDRKCRLGHCHRLAQKWCIEKKLDSSKFTPEQVNSILCTIQRACDNAENPMLYAYTNPTKNFSVARSLKIFLAGATLVGGYFIWERVLKHPFLTMGYEGLRLFVRLMKSAKNMFQAVFYLAARIQNGSRSGLNCLQQLTKDMLNATKSMFLGGVMPSKMIVTP